MHILWEWLAPFGLNKPLILAHQRLQIIGRKLGIEIIALVFLGDLKRFFKRTMIQLQNHIGIHLNEAAIAIPRKARIAR